MEGKMKHKNTHYKQGRQRDWSKIRAHKWYAKAFQKRFLEFVSEGPRPCLIAGRGNKLVS